jgi:hypothetical protein
MTNPPEVPAGFFVRGRLFDAFEYGFCIQMRGNTREQPRPGVTLPAKDYTWKSRPFLISASRYSKQLHCLVQALFLLFYVRESL